MTNNNQQNDTWLDRPIFSTIKLNWETGLFAVILILAAISRFYILGARVISHDETSHVYYAWRLVQGMGYTHTPLTHGPLQFHLVALSYFFFGDNDFTARIPAALFSIATIIFLIRYRRYLGKYGFIVTSIMMLISPFMLYYGRYVRNEAFVGLFGLITIWAILRYLETGKPKFMYWLTAATVLHYTTKETSFIYSAQALMFLGLVFIFTITQPQWKNSIHKKWFLRALIIACVLLLVAAGAGLYGSRVEAQMALQANGENVEGITGIPSLAIWLPVVLSGVAILAALGISILGLGWQKIRENRAFSLIIVQLTLVLPQLAPFPVRMIGSDPLDYSMSGMMTTAIFLVPLLLVSIGLGLLWSPKEWLINAAIFYIPFTLLYTTFFTNGQGFFTGLVGSLGYWLEQQGVERGSQPWYYYGLIQVPIYEYLPAIGSLFALGIVLVRKDWKRYLGLPNDEDTDSDYGEEATEKTNNVRYGMAPFVPLVGFWVVTSLIAYSMAGEKMPWLTFHIALPMILLSGWAIGQLIESIEWKAINSHRSVITLVLIPIFLLSLVRSLGLLLGPTPPFQGQELAQLNATNAFLATAFIAIVTGVILFKLLAEWNPDRLQKLVAISIFGGLAILTARAAIMASYINYDNAKEYLVYAHMARGPKEAIEQIEVLSRRTTNGLAMEVAYDDITTYPYWWYLRNYPNANYFGANPTRELRDAPAILVGDGNYEKMLPVVGNNYYQFDYIRIWWPNQDYFDLTWERVYNAISNREMRNAIFQIWLNRDYAKYGELTDKDMSLPNWRPSNSMRLYVRKDISNQVWNFGSVAFEPEEIEPDPYEGLGVLIPADQVIGTQGSDPGQFNNPRGIAVAPDGSMYITDTGNNRIQHLTSSGQVLHVWGSFADSATGDAPGATFYEPWGIAVADDGSVFVADAWNHRIQKFDSEGNFITTWGFFGQAETGDALWGPRDIVINNQGYLLVTDTGNKRIVVYDQDGNFISEFGSAGMLEAQFDEPVGLALSNDGLLFVADTWNQRIQVFQDPGDGINYEYIREWPIVAWYGQSLDNKPYLAVTSDEHLLVTDPEGYRILEFTFEGQFIRYIGDFGSDLQSYNLPIGVATPDTSGIWLVDSGNHRLLHIPLTDISETQ